MERRAFVIFLPLLLATPVAAQTVPAAGAAVSVPRNVLERYVGRYELNGTIATVGLTGDNRLTVQLTGQASGPPLRTVSANEFASDEVGVHLFFEGEGPKATRIRSQYAGQEVIGSRIAEGNQAAVPTLALGAKDRQEIVAKLSEALRQRYIFPDVGNRVAAKIDASLAAGDYDELSDPGTFALRLTGDAYAIAHDKHLRISTMLAQPPAAAVRMPSAEAGIVRADKLAGGVGYIEVIGFPPPGPFKQALDRAMMSLAGSSALIVDVRRNGGGSPESVTYLSSFLFASDVHLNDIVGRIANTNNFTRTSYRSVPTPVSFAGVPVYILTSGSTFSGGEGFAYEVQAQKRGTVIGEVTGGGANPGGMFALAHSFNVGLPLGRAENPVTKTNWEGRGVQPDIQVPAQNALAAALERAGQKPVNEIGAASLQQVFTPRSTPHPGSETALRITLAGYLSGKPDYDAMTPEFADATRKQLAVLQAQFSPLGELQSMKFLGPDMLGGDEYELHFAGGDRMMGLVLDPAGKIQALSSAIPLPPAP
jgi:hypothetical protein